LIEGCKNPGTISGAQ